MEAPITPIRGTGRDTDVNAWRLDAACRGVGQVGLDRFHNQSKVDQAWAKSVCAQCPVVRDCLEYELTFDRMYSWGFDGVYGGMTTEERRLFWDRLRRGQWASRTKVASGG